MKQFFYLFCYLTLTCWININLYAQRQLGVRPTNSGGVLTPEQASFDVTSYDISIHLYPENKSISSEVILKADIVSPTSNILLDLDSALHISNLELISPTNSFITYSITPSQIDISFNRTLQPHETLELKISYSGKPKIALKPPWIGGFTWKKTENGKPWIATSVQFDGADLWLPCKDHPSDEPDSVSLHIYVPKGLTAVSNGKLMGVSHQNKESRFDWTIHSPINNYNIAINVGPFEKIEQPYTNVLGESMPIQWWILPSHKKKAKAKLEEFADHLAFYEKYLGPYPFRSEKYGIVHTPYLGMEHQTIIAYGSDFNPNEFGWDFLHHHELGHEWWGNLVTASDWKDFWIHEGFCIYMQALYNEDKLDKQAYHDYFIKPRQKVRNKQALAPYESKSTLEKYFYAPCYTSTDGDIYTKGALVLHSLRYLIGDKDFFKALRQMAYPTPEMELKTDGSQCRFVSSDDFIAIVNSITHKDYTWFFDLYLRQPNLPGLISNWNGQELHLKWDTPKKLKFPMPVEISLNGKTTRYELTNGEVKIPMQDTTGLAIDPMNWVYKKEEWKAKQKLRNQLHELLAIKEIKEIPAPDHFKQAYQIIIKEPLDHSNPSSGSFDHSIRLFHSGYDVPNLIETEGYQHYSGTRELSKITKGNQIQVEYRFYGTSRPTPIPWEYLTNDQAIEDYHALNQKLRNIYTGKWMSSGVSKGGETTIIYKSKYPNDIDVAVPYVAPIILDREDPRTDEHINSIGEKWCRDSITAFQRNVLKHYDAIIEEIKLHAKTNNQKFSVGYDVTLEYAVLEFPFSFWQWGGNCNEIPNNISTPKELFKYLDDIVGIDFYSDATIDRLLPSYYQHMLELGYYGFDTTPVKGLLRKVKEPTNLFFAPQNVPMDYKKGYMKDILTNIENNGEQMIYIYGEYDTWGACGVNPNPQLDALKMVLRKGSHATRIKDFSIADQEKIYQKLEEWLETTIEPLEGVCR